MDFKSKKGSISIFVLVALLFMASYLIIAYASNVNKTKTVREQYDIINGIYSSSDSSEETYDKAYADLRQKNKRLITASSEGTENTATIELTKTFEDKVSNYRIYGSSEGVGDNMNLFDINSVTDFILLGNEDTFENGVIKTKCEYGCEFNPGISNLDPGTYILSADLLVENETDGIEWLRIGYRDANKTSHTKNYKTENFNFNWTRVYYEFTLTEDTNIYSFIFGNYGTKCTVLIKNIQLMKTEKSGIQPTKYEPYGKYKINISTISKNLFDINSVNNFYYHNFFGSDSAFWYMATADNNSSLSNISDGVISNISGFWRQPIVCNSNIKKLDAGTYTLSAEAMADKETGILEGKIGWWEPHFNYSNGGSFKLLQYKKWEKISYTFTLTQDTEIMGFLFQGHGDNDDKVENFKFRNIQLEKGDKATEYQEYVGGEIYIDSPLYDGDYIDFKTRKVVRANGTQENINLPQLSTFEDNTKIEVITESKPSRIEVEYTGYTID